MERDVISHLLAECRQAIDEGQYRRARQKLALIQKMGDTLTAGQQMLCMISSCEVCIALGQADQGLAWIRSVLTHHPDHAWALHLQAICLRDLQMDDAAFASWRLALAGDSSLLPAYAGAVATALHRQRCDVAEEFLQQWMQAAPETAQPWTAWGRLHAQAMRYDEARVCFHKALSFDPTDEQASANLGWVYRRLGNLTQAETTLRQGLQRNPMAVDLHWNLASVLLLQGNYPEGFEQFEWRLRRGRTLIVPPDVPRWSGITADLAGKRLLIVREQGVGDCLQMVRFAAPLADAGAAVIWQAAASLQPVLCGVSGVGALCDPAQDENLPADLWCPMMSLPFLLAVDVDRLPAPRRYLAVPDQSCPRAFLPINASDALRIGVVWQGNPDHEDDGARSVPLHRWRDLLSLRHSADGRPIEWICLQAAGNRPGTQADIALFDQDWGPMLGDYGVTAQAVEALDLVISVDTSVLHLAAGLGRPTWGVLPLACDWRWLPSCGEYTPWYPTLRLFRQTEVHAGGRALEESQIAVLAQIRDALGNDRSALTDQA